MAMRCPERSAEHDLRINSPFDEDSQAVISLMEMTGLDHAGLY